MEKLYMAYMRPYMRLYMSICLWYINTSYMGKLYVIDYEHIWSNIYFIDINRPIVFYWHFHWRL